MNALPGALLLPALAGIVPLSITAPPYPAAATSGGTVVAALDLRAGSPSKVKILSGQEPFAGSAQAALMRWKFASKPERARVLAVVCYREPGMFALGTAAQSVSPEGAEADLPFPLAIYEPAFPPDSLGEGSVVLRLRIGADGSLADTEVVRAAGSLTNASIDTARRWKFRAAEDGEGRGTASEIFAVFVFRPPVVTPAPIRR